MKTLLTFIAATLISIAASAQQNVQGMLDAYLEVKDDLVKSDSRQTALHAKEFLEILGSEKSFAEKEAMLGSVRKIAQTNDIEKQRTAFAELSVMMWTLVKNAGKISYDVYYQYCPMKKAYWLSREASIKNPYYGSSMLTCGKVSDKKMK
ncbi:MAG: hypothetical protein FD123_4091 [Bacteroidetes bacterium]|nr:MAG: hypothetical protein FD123_4091 [Bacteroidota bacterium]